MTDARPLPSCECGCGEFPGYYAMGTRHRRPDIPRRFVAGHQIRVSDKCPVVKRFEDCYTIQADGCWLWNTISPGSNGYGKFRTPAGPVWSHRYAYEQAFGPIQDWQQVDHRCHDRRSCKGGRSCRHRACVNPKHLEATTLVKNCRRGSKAKITAAQAEDIRRRRTSGESRKKIADDYGLRPKTVTDIATGRRWSPNPVTGHALDSPTEAMAVGRHGDDDNDGVANQVDPDWSPPDERDEYAHGDDACDPEQEQDERWIGVTRDPDVLEEVARDA